MSESQTMNNPYSSLSSEVNNAMSELQNNDFQYEPQNANEIFKLENRTPVMWYDKMCDSWEIIVQVFEGIFGPTK